jgi:hypothetical protein
LRDSQYGFVVHVGKTEKRSDVGDEQGIADAIYEDWGD